MSAFADLGLSGYLLQSVEDMGFEEPSPIQAMAIPHLLAGKDVLGQARTGTGKTAAFGLPLLDKADIGNKAVQAIVLCPTRELAVQVSEELGRLAARKPGIFILPVYGGQPIERQLRGLQKKPQVVVGTPGRVLDHLQRGTLRLDAVSTAVLDEADEMLDMGFREDIESILERTGENCQRVMFSATMPSAIMELARRFLREPELLRIEHKNITVPAVEQGYYELRRDQKMDALCRLLDSRDFRKTLVFCSTRSSADEAAQHLQNRGYQSDALHGNLAQPQRDRVMSRFRSGSLEVLVATDVAARGLDVEDVDAVVNYDMPHDVESYVHRIGRTGRAGRSGRAFTFVTAREHYKLRDIIRHTGAHISRGQLPSLREVSDLRGARLLGKVSTALESGVPQRHSALVEEFLDRHDGVGATDMAAALLKLLMQSEFGEQEGQEEMEDKLAFTPAPFKKQGRERGQGNAAPGADKKWRKKENVHGPMAWLRFNLGDKKGVRPGDLVGAIAGETGLPSKMIGSIEVKERQSFVEIPLEFADGIMEIMNGGVRIRGVEVNAEKVARGDAPPRLPRLGGGRPGGPARKPFGKKGKKRERE